MRIPSSTSVCFLAMGALIAAAPGPQPTVQPGINPVNGLPAPINVGPPPAAAGGSNTAGAATANTAGNFDSAAKKGIVDWAKALNNGHNAGNHGNGAGQAAGGNFKRAPMNPTSGSTSDPNPANNPLALAAAARTAKNSNNVRSGKVKRFYGPGRIGIPVENAVAIKKRSPAPSRSASSAPAAGTPTTGNSSNDKRDGVFVHGQDKNGPITKRNDGSPGSGSTSGAVAATCKNLDHDCKSSHLDCKGVTEDGSFAACLKFRCVPVNKGDPKSKKKCKHLNEADLIAYEAGKARMKAANAAKEAAEDARKKQEAKAAASAASDSGVHNGATGANTNTLGKRHPHCERANHECKDKHDNFCPEKAGCENFVCGKSKDSKDKHGNPKLVCMHKSQSTEHSGEGTTADHTHSDTARGAGAVGSPDQASESPGMEGATIGKRSNGQDANNKAGSGNPTFKKRGVASDSPLQTDPSASPQSTAGDQMNQDTGISATGSSANTGPGKPGGNPKCQSPRAGDPCTTDADCKKADGCKAKLHCHLNPKTQKRSCRRDRKRKPHNRTGQQNGHQAHPGGATSQSSSSGGSGVDPTPNGAASAGGVPTDPNAAASVPGAASGGLGSDTSAMIRKRTNSMEPGMDNGLSGAPGAHSGSLDPANRVAAQCPNAGQECEHSAKLTDSKGKPVPHCIGDHADGTFTACERYRCREDPARGGKKFCKYVSEMDAVGDAVAHAEAKEKKHEQHHGTHHTNEGKTASATDDSAGHKGDCEGSETPESKSKKGSRQQGAPGGDADPDAAPGGAKGKSGKASSSRSKFPSGLYDRYGRQYGKRDFPLSAAAGSAQVPPAAGDQTVADPGTSGSDPTMAQGATVNPKCTPLGKKCMTPKDCKHQPGCNQSAMWCDKPQGAAPGAEGLCKVKPQNKNKNKNKKGKGKNGKSKAKSNGNKNTSKGKNNSGQQDPAAAAGQQSASDTASFDPSDGAPMGSQDGSSMDGMSKRSELVEPPTMVSTAASPSSTMAKIVPRTLIKRASAQPATASPTGNPSANSGQSASDKSIRRRHLDQNELTNAPQKTCPLIGAKCKGKPKDFCKAKGEEACAYSYCHSQEHVCFA